MATTLRTYLDAVRAEMARLEPNSDDKWLPKLAKQWLDWFTAKALGDKAVVDAKYKQWYSPADYSSAEVELANVEGMPKVRAGTLAMPIVDLFYNDGIHGFFYIDRENKLQPLAFQDPQSQRFIRAQVYGKPSVTRIGSDIKVYGAPWLERLVLIYLGPPLPKGGQWLMDIEYRLPEDLAAEVITAVARKMLGLQMAPSDVTVNARET